MTKIAFLGSKRAGLEVCRLLCKELSPGIFDTIICAEDSEDSRSVINDFKYLANKFNIKLLIASTKKEVLKELDSANPRFVIVHGWYKIIPIDSPKRDFIGFHYSLLPKYRGNAPLVWQIINGEELLGVSCFKLSEGMDQGELLAQKEFILGKNESIDHALNKANNISLNILKSVIPQFLEENVKLFPQPPVTPSYCGARQPEDGLIDWKLSAESVHNLIRALTIPYPGAYTITPFGEKLYCWKSELEGRCFYGVPGSVVEIGDNYIVVACGEGAIRLQEIGYEYGIKAVPDKMLRSLKVRF